MQVQLLTALVRLEEIPASAVKEVYMLLGDESHGIRHAVAELVAGLLQEQGERALKQVCQVLLWFALHTSRCASC